MRPRVFPAEDFVLEYLVDLNATASMRPRVFPAEDARTMRARVQPALLQ